MRYLLLVSVPDKTGSETDAAPASQEPAAAVSAGPAPAPQVMKTAAGPEPPAGPQPVADQEQCWVPWSCQLADLGVQMSDGAMLHPARTAATVRVRDSEVLISDGPFAETKEQVIGYQVIDCADLDTAIAAASCHPAAPVAAIEIRRIADEPAPATPATALPA